jgi:hypothetical protein
MKGTDESIPARDTRAGYGTFEVRTFEIMQQVCETEDGCDHFRPC